MDYVIRSRPTRSWSGRSPTSCSGRRAGPARPLVRYKSFRYQAESWSKPRRIVAKVEHHPGELFARPGFLVTNKPCRVVRWCGSTTSAAPPSSGSRKASRRLTGRGCRAIASERNEVRLRSACSPTTWATCGGTRTAAQDQEPSLTSLQHRLMKTGGRWSSTPRYYWLLIGGGNLNRRLFGDMLRGSGRCLCPVGSVARARINSFWLQNGFAGAVSAGAVQSAQPVCERTDEPWRLSAEVMCRVQREKTWYSGRTGVYCREYQGQNGNPGFKTSIRLLNGLTKRSRNETCY